MLARLAELHVKSRAGHVEDGHSRLLSQLSRFLPCASHSHSSRPDSVPEILRDYVAPLFGKGEGSATRPAATSTAAWAAGSCK